MAHLPPWWAVSRNCRNLTSTIQQLQMAASIFHVQGLTVPQAQNFLHPQARKDSLFDEKLHARCHNTTGAAAGSSPKPFLYFLAYCRNGRITEVKRRPVTSLIPTSDWITRCWLDHSTKCCVHSLLEHLQGLVTPLLPGVVHSSAWKLFQQRVKKVTLFQKSEK